MRQPAETRLRRPHWLVVLTHISCWVIAAEVLVIVDRWHSDDWYEWETPFIFLGLFASLVGLASGFCHLLVRHLWGRSSSPRRRKRIHDEY
jgi:hypothetical protein